MKQLFTLFIAIILPVTLLGQGRLVNSSSERVPKWLNRDVDQYQIIKVDYSSTISLEDAKTKAFELLTAKVVIATTRYMLSQSIGGNEPAIRKSVENSQFVRNISESSALDIYWEERYVKRQNLSLYNYYILYYFNDTEMKKVSLEINAGESNTKKLLDELD